ncbi:MAG TPA: helix-turn-helix domain-containing protein [Tepidisphaeraceae bacterium]|nr:helix-turn-helix domain-containing protein [Tepidisphaeraceae bacterium]
MPTIMKKHTGDTYFELVRNFPLRRLGGVADHSKAKKIYLRLSSHITDRGTRDYLDVLAGLIAEYEQRTNETIDTAYLTAADLIRHRLEERGLSVSALSREIGIPQPNLSDMLNARRDWSKAAIRALTKKFGIRAERFFV